MTKHSTVCGGSSANRYIHCIGSNHLIKKMPKQEASEAAWTGTMLHEVIEETLLDAIDFDPHGFIGDDIEIDDIDPETNQKRKIEVTEQHIVTKILPVLKWFDEVLAPADFWLEENVEFDGELAGAFGTADVLFHDGDKAGIVDWKFGDGVLVNAKDNMQLKFYLAAAIKQEWFAKKTRDPDVDDYFQEFHAYIVQPIEGAKDMVSHTIFTRQELLDFEQELLEAKQLKDNGIVTTTCGSWCQWCPAKPICTGWRNRGQEAIAPLVKGHVSRETLKSGKDKKPTKPSTTKAVCDELDHDELKAIFLEACEMASWIDAVKKYVKNEFEQGRPIDGLKKVVQQMQKQWMDETKAERWCRGQGYTVDDFKSPRMLLSVAKIEKLVGKGKIKEALIRKSAKAFSIVEVSDPRPAVDSNTDDDESASSLLAASLGKNTSL